MTYQIGAHTLSHEAYMREMLGSNGKNKYPGFSDDPIDAFRDLDFDLQNFCSDFLRGSGEQFKAYSESAKRSENSPGMATLMKAEIIAIGSELLTPDRADSNSLFLTARLNRLGIEVARKTIVGDQHEDLRDAFRGALDRVDLVIASGGPRPHSRRSHPRSAC